MEGPVSTPQPITEMQQARWEWLQNVITLPVRAQVATATGDYPVELALVSTAINGIPTVAIALTWFDPTMGDEGGYIIRPEWLLVEEGMFPMLSEPDEGMEEVKYP